jgi:tRNA(Ile)-lysidine synthase
MLNVTRDDVEAFLAEYAVDHITDSSNATDAFLRNRLRRHVMPLLKDENPKLAENLSAMALRLRQDEEVLSHFAAAAPRDISVLRTLFPAVRNRVLEQILKESGVHEPEAVHIRLLEGLIFSENPSAKANFPGGVTISRNYNTLEVLTQAKPSELQFTCFPATELINTPDTFTVVPVGELFVRSRQPGDTIRLSGGTKSIKKLFIDRKIPAARREHIPILCDDAGIIGIPGISVNLDRAAKKLPATQIQFQL